VRTSAEGDAEHRKKCTKPGNGIAIERGTAEGGEKKEKRKREERKKEERPGPPPDGQRWATTRERGEVGGQW